MSPPSSTTICFVSTFVALALGCSASSSEPTNGDVATSSDPEPPAGATVSVSVPEAPSATVSAVATAAPTEKPPAELGDGEFVAKVVVVAGQPSGKRFSAVFLDRADGERWVASYGKDPLLELFEGESVIVSGHRYQPEGRSLAGVHIKIDTLRLAKDEGKVEFAEVGVERKLLGKLTISPAPAGSKLAGSSTRVFTSGDSSMEVANVPENIKPNTEVQVLARVVDPSKFRTGTTGRKLWIIGLAQ